MGTPLFLEGLPILYGTPPKQVLGLEGFRIFTLKQQDLPLPVGVQPPKWHAPFSPHCAPVRMRGRPNGALAAAARHGLSAQNSRGVAERQAPLVVGGVPLF